MAPRLATRPARENDFSNVGQVGRRTGVTLPPGRLDDNGIEEISGIFSSPRKPSPLRKSTVIPDSVEEKESSVTPKQRRSTRKSIPPPRSASPRKSGISGTARRSKAVDVLGQNKEKPSTSSDPVDSEPRPVLTPSLLASAARRFSPDKTPRKDVAASRPQTVRSTRQQEPTPNDSTHNSIEVPDDSTLSNEAVEIQDSASTRTKANQAVDESVAPAVQDMDDQISIAASHEDDEPILPPPFDDEEADTTFEPRNRSKTGSREPTVANSRRKRKSEALEQETEAEVISSPAAKRAKRISDESMKMKQKTRSPKVPAAQSEPAKTKTRAPLKSKDTNAKLSAKQQSELDGIIDRVKARPGQKKSLYVLRRETPADDNVTHTRSGRISVKPLAYWRNEKCVYGGSPGGASLQDGARFPLNSIKEIIRTEEGAVEKAAKRGQKAKKGKTVRKKATKGSSTLSDEDEQESEQSEDDDQQEIDECDDPDAEAWEKERGIFRGPVAEWDPHQQEPLDEGEEIDIAYAPASIETREVKDSTFRYAKMISMKFFGCGIVDLPPGGVKKAKNSRRMHMAFFVANGRVTVHVGAYGGPDNKFSIGKGGWWQVPRGNQYAIENVLSKPARIFFSQACEPLVLEDGE